jgi:hypothetical protein
MTLNVNDYIARRSLSGLASEPVSIPDSGRIVHLRSHLTDAGLPASMAARR